MAGRPRNTVILTEDERSALLTWTRSRTCSQARALRAQIVLACEEEPTNSDVARRLGISRDMVGKWRARFLADRLDGLDEQPRPGRPPTADDDTVAHVLVRTLTPPPPGARQAWSTRSMAAETGLSQSTVNRIWRNYRLQPGKRTAVGPRRTWSLPDHAEEVVGLFLAPPVCVLAVTARAGSGRAARTSAVTATGRPATGRPATGRLFGQDREVPHVLAVACAFAALRGNHHTEDAPWADHPALHTFLEQVRSTAGAGATVHLLAHGVPAQACGALGGPDTTVPARLRWHRAPSPAAWTDETQRLLAADARLPREAAPEPHRLRDALLTWSTTWTPSAAPFTRVAAPRPSYDVPAICGPENDSNAWDARALGHPAAAQITFPDTPPGAPITTDPVVGLLRDAVLAAGHRPGDRVREAPLAVRLGLSRRVVRAGLQALAGEGMLDLLPSGATAVPAITAKDVLDLYALRASLGALLIRRVAMLGQGSLAPASAALAEVRAAARDKDHIRLREVDLWFQDALARTADLPQAAGTFERLTARLRMFVAVLDMDYSPAVDTILNEDTSVYDALRDADGNEAARLWRVKIERCVRYMIAQLPEDDTAPHLWTTLAGRPRLGREEARSAAH
ncbi:helix-turn-helix domain-containing protein [Streptomyces ipomoeae]|uniref:helix-turn-helix domain-containing protein n=1 Tax=Streptomyces ipomoeae TaxID=103232 RepID=UPI0011465B99|nr:helix-turn-helix domain-containing protein [Streptomyces ipomoeae]MDX2938574.1 helix-turn-helix domain-containing protein [Streptomyces ipomoeae]TQE20135.1 FCD domain-containing protein [Streptomyces ipomoeae]